MSNWFANTLSMVSLAVALGSGAYTGLTNWRNQENVLVTLDRDYSAAVVGARPSMTVLDREARNGIKVRYTALISNISNSSSLSIIKIGLIITQFSGFGVVQIPSAFPQEDGRDVIKRTSDGAPIQLPIKLGPGETIELEIFPVFTVSPESGDRVKGGLPAHPGGGLYTFGDDKRDIFGNEGDFFPPNSFIKPRFKTVAQPRLTLRLESGKGFSYEGEGTWYSKVYDGSR